MRHQFVSIDRIFSKFIRDISTDFSEDDIIEWTGEALDFIGTQRILEPYVAFLEVKNHMAPIPKGCLGIEGIARDNRWTGPKASIFCPKKIVTEVVASDTAPTVPVALDCKGTPVNAYELAYYRPYFDFKYDYNTFSNTTCFQAHYTPVREATHTFFGTKVDNNVATDRYTIVQDSILKFSFKSGYIAIGCKKSKTDPKTGYPMIPDSIAHTTAIVTYINKKRAEKDMDLGRQGAMQRVQYWSEQWQWYCGQASNNDKMLQGVDELQNFLDQRTQLIPQTNHYNNFFGNLASPQNSWEGYEEGEFEDTEGETVCDTDANSCDSGGTSIPQKAVTIVNQTINNTSSSKGILIGIAGAGGVDDPIVGLSYYQNNKLKGLNQNLTIKVDSFLMDSYGINKSFDFNPSTGRIDFTQGYIWVALSSIAVDLNQ